MSVAMRVHSRRRSRPLILILLLLAVTFFVVDRSGDGSPTHALRSVVRDGSASIAGTVRSIWPFQNDGRVKSLQRENDDLRNKLAVVEGDLARVADAERERKNLSELLGLATADSAPKVIAQVTAIGASNFDSTMEIGKGYDDGIRTGMPVMTGAGLVGRVIQTTNSRATVLLITDTTFTVSVRLPNGDVAAAVGEGVRKPIRVDLVDIENPLAAGDPIVTSGLDRSLFPPGIPIGRVTETTAGNRDLRKNVRVQPLADLRNASEVAVVQWTP
jgi:rod shape-determining protein MreC